MVYYPADKRYRAKAIMRVYVDVNRNTEPDIAEKLQNVENKAGYIKGLIRADIAADEDGEHDEG